MVDSCGYPPHPQSMPLLGVQVFLEQQAQWHSWNPGTHPHIFPTIFSPKPWCPLDPCFLLFQYTSMALHPRSLNKNENQWKYLYRSICWKNFTYNSEFSYRSTIVDNLHFVKVEFIGMAPQHSRNKVVDRRDRLVYIPEEHVQKILQITSTKNKGDDTLIKKWKIYHFFSGISEK